MSERRVLAIYLDGYEDSVGRRWMDEGKLPALARLRAASARFDIYHGAAERTGLAGEHFSTGLSPDAAGRWAAVSFDKDTYEAWQAGNTRPPFIAGMDVRTVVFDPTYFNLELAPGARGLVNWGAHDPGVPAHTRPDGLLDEITGRFGPYPATPWLYGFAWPSERRCQHMGERLAEAVHIRTEAATWLLRDRMPDWDLGIVTTGELHSVTEALWFGIDPSHPLHGHGASAAAAEGMLRVYRAVDEMVGRFQESFPDATLVVFAMGGMGPNRSDVPSMVLLPELLYRRAFGTPLLRPRPEWAAAESGCPLLAEDEQWGRALYEAVPGAAPVGKKERKRQKAASGVGRDDSRMPMNWMPSARYQPYWAEMDAFALPSFYDGRVRINLAGRERQGGVALGDYRQTLSEIVELVQACIDPRTGESIVDCVEETAFPDPLNADPTACDLTIVWRGTAQALAHPELGTIGPVPFNRTGGHTGKHGIAYLCSAGIEAKDRGYASSFDVAPTILDLLGKETPAGMSGRSLLGQ